MSKLNARPYLGHPQLQYQERDKDDCILFSTASVNLNNIFFHLRMHYDFVVNFYKFLTALLLDQHKYALIFWQEDFFKLTLLFS